MVREWPKKWPLERIKVLTVEGNQRNSQRRNQRNDSKKDVKEEPKLEP